MLYCRLQHPWHLRRAADELTIMAAFPEQRLWVRLLEIARSDLRTRDMRGDDQYRRHAAVRIIDAIEEVHIARSAAADTYRQLTRQLGFGACRKRRNFFVPVMPPFDRLVFPYLMSNGIGRVSHKAMDLRDTRLDEGVDDHFCDSHKRRFD